MTYFGFLALFVGIPIVILLILTWWDKRRGITMSARFDSFSPWWVLFIMIIIAVIYTTPWDNYLVATRVWWYDVNLVTGYVIGWVPIEEYTFFIVQPIMTGLWLLFWMRRTTNSSFITPHSSFKESARLRIVVVGITAVFWAVMVAILISGWKPGTYLALELSWALFPILIQLAFGFDILWYYRRLVLLGILVPTVYLAFADSLAIQAGTWTIDPQQSLNIFIGNLPVEEFIFFLLTNTLLVFGMTLALAAESQPRLQQYKSRLTHQHDPQTTESTS
ncbi:MAG: lycopene cyclase domain-containing protein [Anaerolineae bacterium]|nr:lycopene cyclase domain-containing protein [Anaerolineae bacterium]